MSRQILTAGDLVADLCLYEAQQLSDRSNVREGAVVDLQLGGAALLHRLLETWASSSAPGWSAVAGFAASASDPTLRCGSGFWIPCDQVAQKDPPQVWRMTQSAGFTELPVAAPAARPPVSALEDSAEIVVLEDLGLEYRQWNNRAAWPKFLRPATPADVSPPPAWIVLKMSRPLAAGDLWHTIASGETQSDRNHFSIGDMASRTIVVLAAEDVRQELVRVEGLLSWERAATDLADDLERNPRLNSLKQVRFVVVSFGTDGALVIDRTEPKSPKYFLVFDPAGTEGHFLSQAPKGRVVGYQCAFVAGLVAKLTSIAAGASSDAARKSLIAGSRAGLAAGRRLHREGHGAFKPGQRPCFPTEQIAVEIQSPKWTFGVAELPASTAWANWSIVTGASAPPPKPLWGLARRVALRGIGQLTQTPYLQFGKLFAVDRSEIESLRSLQRLLLNYRGDAKASKPLSIAAFGPPGSGKSFGVKQLAGAVFDDPVLLEFNLSQFQHAGELHGLFHQIRDQVLRGKLPVVFWDEFDSQKLNWLQYLLAPMEDGTFQEGQITHPIGKCVFVFAGGTRDRFEDFGEPPAWDPPDPIRAREWLEDFKTCKGPDFKSRLAGYINVLGPNPAQKLATPRSDLTFPVRRALLLRVQLDLGKNEPLLIDPGLLDAFLRIPRYKHGARSLGKIAEQVRLSSRGRKFTRSDLPPRQQLDLHVDADKFLQIVEKS